MTHDERRDARDVFSERIRDDLERERVRFGLDALVNKYEQRVARRY